MNMNVHVHETKKNMEGQDVILHILQVFSRLTISRWAEPKFCHASTWVEVYSDRTENSCGSMKAFFIHSYKKLKLKGLLTVELTPYYRTIPLKLQIKRHVLS